MAPLAYTAADQACRSSASLSLLFKLYWPPCPSRHVCMFDPSSFFCHTFLFPHLMAMSHYFLVCPSHHHTWLHIMANLATLCLLSSTTTTAGVPLLSWICSTMHDEATKKETGRKKEMPSSYVYGGAPLIPRPRPLLPQRQRHSTACHNSTSTYLTLMLHRAPSTTTSMVTKPRTPPACI
jgi:hypothetical protein